MNEEKEKICKDSLRQARLFLNKAQDVWGASDSRWQELNEIIEPIEELIMRKW